MGRHCPSHDWDRYIAAMEGPMPVGDEFDTVSPQPHRCDNCGGMIPAETPHRRLDYHDDEGHFIRPQRTHAKGQCLAGWDDLP